MDVLSSVLNNMEDILGLPRDEMEENLDKNLIEDGLIDSLSLVELLSCIESELGVKISITKLEPKDITTVNSLVSAIERIAQGK